MGFDDWWGRRALQRGCDRSRERDTLGIWAGDGGEGTRFWLGVLTEIRNRGVEDMLIVVCDGLRKGGAAVGDYHDVGTDGGADVIIDLIR